MKKMSEPEAFLQTLRNQKAAMIVAGLKPFKSGKTVPVGDRRWRIYERVQKALNKLMRVPPVSPELRGLDVSNQVPWSSRWAHRSDQR